MWSADRPLNAQFLQPNGQLLYNDGIRPPAYGTHEPDGRNQGIYSRHVPHLEIYTPAISNKSLTSSVHSRTSSLQVKTPLPLTTTDTEETVVGARDDVHASPTDARGLIAP